MKMENIVWMCAGAAIGLAVTFYETDPAPSNECVTYKVKPKAVTAYVLKPPPAEIRYEACQQVEKKVEPVTCEPDQVKETAKSEHEPRRHRRYHRIRRYWR